MSKQSQATAVYNLLTENGLTHRYAIIEILMKDLNVGKSHASSMFYIAQKLSDKAEMIIGDAPFVLFDKDTTVYASDTKYKTVGAARSGLTNLSKDRKNTSNVGIAGAVHFATNIEKTHVVLSAMNGAEVTESVNTPFSCSVASEHYWCS